MTADHPTIIAHTQHMLASVADFNYYLGPVDGSPLTFIIHGCGPIHYAAMNSHDSASVVEKLLDAGANIHLRDTMGQTALHRAAFHRRKNIVKALLDRGADVNVRDEEGNAPLTWAVIPNKGMDNPYTHPNQTPVIRSLLVRGANVNARNKEGLTPLMFAAEGFSLDVVKVLLEAGADVRNKSRRNCTCLHYLFFHPGKKNMLKELVKAGAPVFDRDNFGLDSIDCIVSSREHNMEQKVEELKELMKIATLVNYTEKLYFRINCRLRNGIGMFDDECYAEVQTMKSITLSPTCALCDFALHGISQNKPSVVEPNCQNPKTIVDLAFEKWMEQNFSIYNDYLASHFDKDYLVDKLMEKEIIIYSFTGLVDVKLRDHLISDFCEFLTKTDICNLLNVIFNSEHACPLS